MVHNCKPNPIANKYLALREGILLLSGKRDDLSSLVSWVHMCRGEWAWSYLLAQLGFQIVWFENSIIKKYCKHDIHFLWPIQSPPQTQNLLYNTLTTWHNLHILLCCYWLCDYRFSNFRYRLLLVESCDFTSNLTLWLFSFGASI